MPLGKFKSTLSLIKRVNYYTRYSTRNSVLLRKMEMEQNQGKCQTPSTKIVTPISQLLRYPDLCIKTMTYNI